MKLEDLKPETVIKGIIPDASVTVASITWHGTEALTLIYRGPDGKVEIGRAHV